MTGTHEGATIATLRKSVESDYPNVSAAVREFGRAINLVRENASLEETMRRVGIFTLAAKMLHESAKRVWEGSRDALASAFEETGVPRVRTAGHTVSSSEGVRPVHIIREADIPARFWVTPKPRISIPLLREALEAGEDLGGAAVLANAGTVHVRFSKREKRGAAT